jgi:1,4-dihydroxy-2-naphthoate octaprenyltransferase
MDNPILTMFSLCNYEKHMRKYPTDEMKEQMIREIANKVKMSLYQAALTFIAICAGYTLAQLVF